MAATAGHGGVEGLYEDMFKEITRKLYGEEAGPGLHGTPMIAQVATGGHLSLPEGERSFTTLNSDNHNNKHRAPDSDSKEHLFGLAALMQTGFAAQHAEDGDPEWSESPTTSPQRKRSSGSRRDGSVKPFAQDANGQTTKRYGCSHCPYSTDRRDLYTRHENIHKEEKPFFCYICTKQFNRADHVKKHFMRMHRDLDYDINKTRRTASNRTMAPQVATLASSTMSDDYYENSVRSTPATPTHVPTLMSPPIRAPANNPPPQHVQISAAVPALPMPSLPPPVAMLSPVSVKHEPESPTKRSPSPSSSPGKKRKFSCCYCSWTGADNWGLKRHLNTHTKPYVCTLCDYKAARSERLVTHVHKVHNKKACNKCSFMAEDHRQYMAHQQEAHPLEARSSVAHEENNILRAIGNSSSGDRLFGGGGLGHNVQFSGANASSSPWQLEALSSTQKLGAERLLQYMDAEDDSDAFDYQKQMQMVALSRSARNIVVQDFQKAAAGVRHKQERIASRGGEVATVEKDRKAGIASKVSQEAFIRDLEQFIVQRLNGENGTAATAQSQSPAKRSRFNSRHDKENQSGQPAQAANAQQMRDIFQMMAKHYGDLAQKEGSAAAPKPAKDNNLSDLERILRNNRELTVSIKDQAVSREDSGLDEEEEEEDDMDKNEENAKSKRKCFVPRKIDTESVRNPRAVLDKIRDKHLSRLMSKRKSCHLCANRKTSFNTPYHTTASLVLHKIWRHARKSQKCNQCDLEFKLPYQLRLHSMLKHS